MGKSILILTIALGIVAQVNSINNGPIKDDIPHDTHMKCVPNTSFIYDHNKCYCNNVGTELTCKRKIYSTLLPELHLIQLQNLTVNCRPGTQLKAFNQDCICHESGKFASCIRNRDGSNDTRESCIPGAVFEDNCNRCICGTDGKATCTRLDCDIFAVANPAKSDLLCVPRSNFVYGCNNCSCSNSGTSMNCDKMECGSTALIHGHILNVTMNCGPSSLSVRPLEDGTFKYYHHICRCDTKGEYAMCSGAELSSLRLMEDTVERCNPGMIFASDCNICICAENRKGVCTTFSCDTIYKFKYFDKYIE